MSLHSIHRAVSIARHKTLASFKSVFLSHGHSKSSPMLMTISRQSFLTSEIGPNKGEEASSADDNPPVNYRDRIYDAFDGSDSSSEDEGYFTANEDQSREFEDRDSDNSSTEAGDDIHESTSKQDGQKWGLQSTSKGNSNIMEISELRPVSKLRDSVIDSESEERLKEVC